jgi:hypothetical protein
VNFRKDNKFIKALEVGWEMKHAESGLKKRHKNLFQSFNVELILPQKF